MKHILISILLTIPIIVSAQTESVFNKEDLKVIYINKDISTHFISPEAIEYVDISIAEIAGNIPLKNTLRVKPLQDGASGVLTITTERFLVQYLLIYTNDLSKVYSRYNIPYSDVKSFLSPESTLTTSQLYDYCYSMLLSKNNFNNISSKKHGIRIRLNNIYTLDKYFFIDISMFNKSNIQFDIDDIKFYLEDKRQTKATTFQSIYLKPLLSAQHDLKFKKKYRNIFVFEKFTFPEEKVFIIEIREKQLSGRIIQLEVEYKDILNADIF